MKKFVLMLTVLMCFVLFAGCADDNNASSDDSNPSNEVVSSEVAEEGSTDDQNAEEDTKEPEVPLSNYVTVPSEADAETLVDTGSELNVAVAGVDSEYTKRYVQSLVNGGFSLDYEFDVAEGSQYSLSKGDITVSILFKNDEMIIYATKSE